VQNKQGRALYGVDMKIVGDDGEELPRDGTSFGDLLVRGPCVIREYYNDAGSSPLVRPARKELVSDRRRSRSIRWLHADHRPHT
jgi:fatty-acyl-CoA synthase